MNRGSPIVLAVLLCGACSTLPPNVAREPSFAFADPEATSLGAAFQAQLDAHPGDSGFVPVLAGANAFLLRAAMAGLAEHTLDLQYYIWEDDLTGQMMLLEALRAADRGVRVRLLLDDTTTGHETDIFTRADAHPLVEVRLFNPFTQRDVRLADWMADGVRLNHRMHNKLMVTDNTVAITGGRNIGNHYFAVDEVSNFRDLDLLAAGPIVQDLSSMFDLYWNSEWSYPVGVIDRNRYTGEDAKELMLRLRDDIEGTEPPFPLDADTARMRERLLSFRPQLEWGKAYAVFDSPARVDGEDASMRGVAEVLFDSVEGVQEALLIETAYFIPGDAGVKLLRGLVEQGIDVTVLTNSLATNDVAAAHAGYMDYRKPLLEAGVNLYELRPDAVASKKNMTLLASDSEAALHTKALVYDRRTAFVGSFNLDPRSLMINTEMGVLVRSPELARQVAEMIGEGLRPANSYRLSLHDGELRWHTIVNGESVYLDTEPETSWWERFVAGFLSLLPIDGQL